METEREGTSDAITFMRWSARVLGVIIAGFSLYMFIGESLDSHTQGEGKPIELIKVIFGPMGIYVGAMFLALKWERAGALIGGAALGSFFVMMFLGLAGNAPGGFSTGGVLNPFLLAFWLPVLLYLLCWVLERRGRKKAVL